MSSLTEARRAPLDWVALGLLAALVAANVLSLALLPTGGPLLGIVLYAGLLWRWERRDYGSTVAGGLAGLVVHAVEVTTRGWSAYPDLMALNLVLPALLALVGCSLSRQARQGGGSQQR